MSFYDKVYDVVKKIPKGKVATYGQIAHMCQSPRASRAVGYALHCNPEPGVIPCHRVVNRQGRLAPAFAFGGVGAQKQLLEAENVEVGIDDIVDLKKCLWIFDELCDDHRQSGVACDEQRENLENLG